MHKKYKLDSLRWTNLTRSIRNYGKYGCVCCLVPGWYTEFMSLPTELSKSGTRQNKNTLLGP